MQPVPQVIPSTAGQVTDDVLISYLEKSRGARARESGYFRFFGPRFTGDYSSQIPADLELGFAQIWAAEIRHNFDPTIGDFGQFWGILSKAQNATMALEVWEVAKSAYKTAEDRTKAQIAVLQAIASDHSASGLFDELAEDCSLDWATAEKAENVMLKRALAEVERDSQALAAAAKERAAGVSEEGDSGTPEDAESVPPDEPAPADRGPDEHGSAEGS